ncbi:hypothetical protein [Nostoc sp.]|uniref:hypothetical protein n=1 Tax=Nostoc sp. TaxID=1180 RepID=UPI002FF9F542
MNKQQFNSILLKSSLLTTFLLPTLFLIWPHSAKVLAECSSSNNTCNSKNESSSCNSKNPYNLAADTTKLRRIRISWDVCQKNDFYQISWGDSKDDLEQIDDATARSWTYTGARDSTKYTFKVRGCNNHPTQDAAKQPDCTPWTESVVTTPDW